MRSAMLFSTFYFYHFRTCFSHVRRTFLLFIWFCLRAKFIANTHSLPIWEWWSASVFISVFLSIFHSENVCFLRRSRFRSSHWWDFVAQAHNIFCPSNFHIPTSICSIPALSHFFLQQTEWISWKIALCCEPWSWCMVSRQINLIKCNFKFSVITRIKCRCRSGVGVLERHRRRPGTRIKISHFVFANDLQFQKMKNYFSQTFYGFCVNVLKYGRTWWNIYCWKPHTRRVVRRPVLLCCAVEKVQETTIKAIFIKCCT